MIAVWLVGAASFAGAAAWHLEAGCDWFGSSQFSHDRLGAGTMPVFIEVRFPTLAPETARGSALVDHDAWDRDVADLVLRALPSTPARVLEVGCGEGRLARSMAAAGHHVVAIDPDAPEGPLFKRVTIEEFVAPQPFDAAVATLSLHHIVELDAAVAKIADLVVTGGTFVVVEFASDRFDEATAAWALKRLVEGNEHGWLSRRRNEWKAQDGGADAAGFAAYLRRWAASEKFHSAAAMVGVCRSHFDEMQFEAWPYLYPELEDITREQEIAEIKAGRIQATGFSFVGSARSP